MRKISLLIFIAIFCFVYIPDFLWAKDLRIVSLVPSSTEIICALGLRDNLVGVTTYCDYPPEVLKIDKIGNTALNTEKIISLNPDVLVDTNSAHGRYAPFLQKLGYSYINLKIDNLQELLSEAKRLSDFLGKPEAYLPFKEKYEKAINSLRFRMDKKPRIYIEVWNIPWQTAGGNTFINDIIERAGGVNIFKKMKNYKSINFEMLISRDPDIVLLAYPQADPKEFAAREGFSALKAVRAGRVYKMPYDLFVRPSPRNLEATAHLNALIERISE
ncbi:MAG: ABC transporter substrate-binding protein [Candidatus Riflebacteria bacterium]|nr:ABC transporter substrate-binding protein [Candidatus Riflebacteria bacterium]